MLRKFATEVWSCRLSAIINGWIARTTNKAQKEVSCSLKSQAAQGGKYLSLCCRVGPVSQSKFKLGTLFWCWESKLVPSVQVKRSTPWIIPHLFNSKTLASQVTIPSLCCSGEDVRPDYEAVASAVFSSPPIATVGLTEEQAHEKYGDIDIYSTAFKWDPRNLPKQSKF